MGNPLRMPSRNPLRMPAAPSTLAGQSLSGTRLPPRRRRAPSRRDAAMHLHVEQQRPAAKMKGGRGAMHHHAHDDDGPGALVDEEWAEDPGGDADGDGYDDATGKVTNKNTIIYNIIVYICFMFFFTLLTTRGTNNADIYYFGANLKGQLTGVEMNPEHSPTWPCARPQRCTVSWMPPP